MTELFNTNFQTERQQEKSFGFWLTTLLLLIGLTQGARILITKFGIDYFINEKFAFSLDIPVAVMYIVYILVMITVVIFLQKQWQIISDAKRLGFILIVSGGLANVFERIFLNHVVDYIFILSGVLNLADLYIIVGALLVVIDKNIFKKTSTPDQNQGVLS